MRLVAKLNDKWGVYEVNGEYIPHPNTSIYCPMKYGDKVCGGELILHDFRAYYHPPVNHYHIDVHMKCSKCGMHYTFGLPIPKELFNKLQQSKYHGKVLREELNEIYELPEEVVKRLESWGYW